MNKSNQENNQNYFNPYLSFMSYWITVFQIPVIDDIRALKLRVTSLEEENHKLRKLYYDTKGD